MMQKASNNPLIKDEMRTLFCVVYECNNVFRAFFSGPHAFVVLPEIELTLDAESMRVQLQKY